MGEYHVILCEMRSNCRQLRTVQKFFIGTGVCATNTRAAASVLGESVLYSNAIFTVCFSVVEQIQKLQVNTENMNQHSLLSNPQ